jgi:hypothetical protein
MGSVAERKDLINWLLDGSPWVVYRTLVDLLEKKQDDGEVLAARKAVAGDPLIKKIFRRQDRRGWWGDPGDMHKWWPRKDTTFWMLPVLADFGLTMDEPHLARAAECVMDLQLPGGGFLGWEPHKAADCHTAILLEPLAQMGLGDDPRISKAYHWLLSRQRHDGGWWCKGTGQPGGPRAAEPSCPFATMFVLGALAQRPMLIPKEASHRAVCFLLNCWAHRGRVKYPGHDSQIGPSWEKLKYPFTDYRILKFLEVLSHFPSARGDPRTGEMLTSLQTKADDGGRFRPESIVRTWAKFDFGQKKEPSRWITVLAWRVMGRVSQKKRM